MKPDSKHDQTSSELEQTRSDRDQTHSDSNQTQSDRDQTSSDRDQDAADRDQLAADEDQAASDRALDGRPDDATYRSSRRTRIATTIQRDMATQSRRQTATIRDATAERRDLAASERDAAARDRDRLADARDAELERWERSTAHIAPSSGARIVAKAAYERRRAAEDRARAADHRQQAARDRERANQDRQQAALDREAAAEELDGAGVDELTQTLTRRVGLPALQRELDRVERTEDPLVLAFVDVDGLKRVNDGRGHLAGDRLLQDVAQVLKADLRPYDLVIRFGGDEFLCSLTGAAIDGVRQRFERVAALIGAQADATISVGYAERRAEESVESLIERADGALIAGRRPR